MALTSQQETDLLALLAAASIDPADIKRAYDLNQSAANVRRNFCMAVDKSDLSEAEKLLIGDLLYNITLDGQGSGNDFQAITPKTWFLTKSSTSLQGTIKTSSDANAINPLKTDIALVPSNVNPILDDRFSVKKTYGISDVDSGTSNVAFSSLSIKQVAVGKKVTHYCNASIIVSSTLPSIEIGINSILLPDGIFTGNGTWFNPSENANLPLGVNISVDTGKLKIKLASADGSDFGAATYTMDFTYEFLIA